MLLITFNIIDITKTTDVMELNTEFMAVPSSLVQPGKPDDTLPVSSNNILKILNQVECVCSLQKIYLALIALPISAKAELPLESNILELSTVKYRIESLPNFSVTANFHIRFT